jgi:hypothetical protein
LSVFFQVVGVLPPLAHSVVQLFASSSTALDNYPEGGAFVESCKKIERPPGNSQAISWFWTTSRSRPGIFEPTILVSGCIPRGHYLVATLTIAQQGLVTAQATFRAWRRH